MITSKKQRKADIWGYNRIKHDNIKIQETILFSPLKNKTKRIISKGILGIKKRGMGGLKKVLQIVRKSTPDCTAKKKKTKTVFYWENN